jgi:DNA-binding transcriptional MerR regulator
VAKKSLCRHLKSLTSFSSASVRFVLRFWETEFPNLAPEKSKSGHRVYKRKDIENILRVKELLYERGYTIAGARKQLARARAPKPEREKVLIQIRNELRDILTLLRRKT